MADRTLLVFAPFVDFLENGVENFFGEEGVTWKDGAVLDVVEASIFRVPELQYRRAADDVIPVCQRNSEVFKSTGASKIYPPGRLHKP